MCILTAMLNMRLRYYIVFKSRSIGATSMMTSMAQYEISKGYWKIRYRICG